LIASFYYKINAQINIVYIYQFYSQWKVKVETYYSNKQFVVKYSYMKQQCSQLTVHYYNIELTWSIVIDYYYLSSNGTDCVKWLKWIQVKLISQLKRSWARTVILQHVSVVSQKKGQSFTYHDKSMSKHFNHSQGYSLNQWAENKLRDESHVNCQFIIASNMTLYTVRTSVCESEF
jgi:hypothetical protein